MNKQITIIVPIYRDWITLEKCITSLKRYVNIKHKILLINDISNQADFLEKKIKENIQGFENFHYFRNKENLGFVKTCNRAVFELDKTENNILLLNSDTEVTEGFLEEMVEVLNLTDRHGVVCPRSNNATILSVPLQYDGERKDIIESSFESWKKIKNKLQRFQQIPTGVGFCMLIRRDLIRNFELFDEIYGKGYNEENDFCFRINQFGYSVAMANHAFVFHFEGKSFGTARRNEQEEKNVKILTRRYREFIPALEKYVKYQLNPFDYFSDVFSEIYPKKRILFSLYNLPPLHNGTSEYGISLLEEFYSCFKDKYDIDVLTNKEGDSFHKISEKFNVIYNNQKNVILKRYDLVISPSQIFEIKHLLILNRVALRIVIVIQDIIAWRTNHLNRFSDDAIGKLTLKYSDGIITISDFVKNDVQTYFNTIKIDQEKIRTIYHGIGKDVVGDAEEKIPFRRGDYVMVIGNHFKHKMIKKVALNLKKSKLNYVFIGIGKDNLEIKMPKNFFFLKSGNLSENLITSLYQNCSFILFPSQYEGFGLPILKALKYGKGIILFDNDLNKEIKKAFLIDGNQMYFFQYFSQLPELTENVFNAKLVIEKRQNLRSWKDVAIDTEKFIATILETEINKYKLYDRWETLNALMPYEKEYVNKNFWNLLNPQIIFSKIVFILFSPRKFFNKYKKKIKRLCHDWFFSFKNEGLVKSLKRLMNYILKGKGII